MSEIANRACLEDPNSVQLGLIGEIQEALRSRLIPHWLSGGWAVDFLLGEVSRVHGDIDWAIWKTDAPEVTACLGTLGYSQQKVRHPDEHIGFYGLDQYVSFGLLEKTQSGDVVTSGRWTDWPYPHGAFCAPEGRLGDLSCPILSAEAQLDEKVNFHKHPAGAPLRDVDLPAIQKLRKYIARQRRQ